MCMCVYVCTYIYIYIYIYMYMLSAHSLPWSWRQKRNCRLARDRGGPTKGGFLNNRLFSYADLYLCNEINGMCIHIIYYSGKS